MTSEIYLFTKRVRRYYNRKAAHLIFKRPLVIHADRPTISFTFDDFPKTALHTGGAILQKFDIAGTYYASLGLIGQDSPSGRLFDRTDLNLLYERGHELGCHTFQHCHSGDTTPRVFEEAIDANQRELDRLVPGKTLHTFAYPVSEPRPFTKRRTARHFLCSRGAGQTFNSGTTDLNNLAAYFLEKSRDSLSEVTKMIDLNRRAGGWLIFATHDIADDPSPYGCRPGFFETVVQYAVESKTRILPVVDALRALQGGEQGLHTCG